MAKGEAADLSSRGRWIRVAVDETGRIAIDVKAATLHASYSIGVPPGAGRFAGDALLPALAGLYFLGGGAGVAIARIF